MRRESNVSNTYHFSDLVDIATLARLLDSFYQATGIPNGIMDANGELLCMSSGNNACVVFHRSHPVTAERCRECNLELVQKLHDGCVAGELCQNGLMNYATPVVVEGCQLATVFLGQILHDAPDEDYFRAQASKLGFEEKDYLESIAAVPVVNKVRVNDLMDIMVEMARLLATSGLARLRQTELERDVNLHAERSVWLKDILDFFPVAMSWSENDQHIGYVNRQFTQLFGYTLEDIPSLEIWLQRAYPDANYREAIIGSWREAVARRDNVESPELEVNVTCKDGSVRSVIARANWVGRRHMVSFTDITERKRNEQRMRAHDAMLEMVARGADLSAVLNALVQHVESEEKAAMCSIMLADAEVKHLYSTVGASLPPFYLEAINGIEIAVGVGSCCTAAALGERVIVEDIMEHEYWKPYRPLAEKAGLHACWSEPILSPKGKVLGTFATYHAQPQNPQTEDLERIAFATNLAAIAIENHRVREEIERQAHTDYLTGLANRRHFMSQAESELARTLRYDKPLSLLMLDIDRFKQVNDTHGHKVGDLVLQRLAAVCRDTLRNIDIIGRLGGEEFAVLLPETGGGQAEDAAERLRAALAIAEVRLDDGLPLHFTASIGVATLVEKETNIDILLSQADHALYRAKRAGRDQVCLYLSDEPALYRH